jgi:hypothetical protein
MYFIYKKKYLFLHKVVANLFLFCIQHQKMTFLSTFDCYNIKSPVLALRHHPPFLLSFTATVFQTTLGQEKS